VWILYLKTLVLKTELVKIWNTCHVLEIQRYRERERERESAVWPVIFDSFT